MLEAYPSDVVRSLAGHDKGMLFFVIETGGEYASLVDGKRRKLQKPKRKKQKHIELVSKGDAQSAQSLKTASDKEIRKALAVFLRELKSREVK